MNEFRKVPHLGAADRRAKGLLDAFRQRIISGSLTTDDIKTVFLAALAQAKAEGGQS